MTAWLILQWTRKDYIIFRFNVWSILHCPSMVYDTSSLTTKQTLEIYFYFTCTKGTSHWTWQWRDKSESSHTFSGLLTPNISPPPPSSGTLLRFVILTASADIDRLKNTFFKWEKRKKLYNLGNCSILAGGGWRVVAQKSPVCSFSTAFPDVLGYLCRFGLTHSSSRHNGATFGALSTYLECT